MLTHRACPFDTEEPTILTERIFERTFEVGNTQKDMELYYQTSYSADIQLQEILGEDWIALVYEYESKLIGYAQLRQEAFPPCINSIHAGEVLCLYVDGPYHGKGLVRALIHEYSVELAAQGSGIVWLGIWEQNPRAIFLYCRLGFTEVGEYIFLAGTDPQGDIIMEHSTGVS